ncbi:unnamed protein product [Victoria cruziana]
MCCPGRICRLCICLIILVIIIGFVFGFGIFAHGFHKIKQCINNGCSSKMQIYSPTLPPQGYFRFPGPPVYYP